MFHRKGASWRVVLRSLCHGEKQAWLLWTTQLGSRKQASPHRTRHFRHENIYINFSQHFRARHTRDLVVVVCSLARPRPARLPSALVNFVLHGMWKIHRISRWFIMPFIILGRQRAEQPSHKAGLPKKPEDSARSCFLLPIENCTLPIDRTSCI